MDKDDKYVVGSWGLACRRCGCRIDANLQAAHDLWHERLEVQR